MLTQARGLVNVQGQVLVHIQGQELLLVEAQDHQPIFLRFINGLVMCGMELWPCSSSLLHLVFHDQL